ncbi:MAG TPA: CsgG/HfaB family protein [Bryobacteraceae bacterium]
MKLFSCVFTAAVAVLPLMAQAPQKHRVAVLDFQYGAVMGSVQAMFGTSQDVGRGISDLLINRLVNDGTYRVIERNALDKILHEQNFSNSDRADANTAAKIGRVLGVDAIIVGDITQFGRDDKHTNVGGAFSHWTSGYGVGGVGRHKAKAIVEITARIIDVNTGEILASVTGHGESKRSGTSLLGGGGNWGNSGGGSLDMGSSNFQATILGEAVKQSVDQLATGLDHDADKLQTVVVKINGEVADTTGGSITINVGSRAGVHTGEKLEIARVTRVIKDPVTGKVLRAVRQPIGEIQITQVGDTYAVGSFTGSGQPKVGDAVTNLSN